MAWCCGFYPAKSLNGPSSRILNGPGTKSWLFEGQKSRGPLQKSRFCARDHFESLNWPHFVIWQGRIHNTKPHLQHSCIGNFMQPVLNSFLRPFFGGVFRGVLLTRWTHSHTIKRQGLVCPGFLACLVICCCNIEKIFFWWGGFWANQAQMQEGLSEMLEGVEGV